MGIITFVTNILYDGPRAWPTTVTAQSKAWIVFARSNIGVVGSNPTRGMDVCMRLFCVYSVVVCVGSGLATSWSPVQESYRLCMELRNWKSGYTAIERERERKSPCAWRK
jgi:hypothetical protein